MTVIPCANFCYVLQNQYHCKSNLFLRFTYAYQNNYRYNCTLSLEKNSVLIFPGEGTTHYYNIEPPKTNQFFVFITNLFKGGINREQYGTFDCAGFEKEEAYEDLQIVMSQKVAHNNDT